MKILWLEVDGNKEHPPLPEWVTRAGIDECGNVWVPAQILGPELLVFLLASWDNETTIIEGDHTYVRAEWMKRELKEIPLGVELCDKMALKCRYALQMDSVAANLSKAQ